MADRPAGDHHVESSQCRRTRVQSNRLACIPGKSSGTREPDGLRAAVYAAGRPGIEFGIIVEHGFKETTAMNVGRLRRSELGEDWHPESTEPGVIA